MENINVLIYHTTDMHNRRKAFPFLKQLRKDGRTILLDSGDAILGSSTIFIEKETILDEMFSLGYDAIAIGNREFHYLRKIFERRMAQTGIPFISANLSDLGGAKIFHPYIIKEVNGAKVGITGITPIQYSRNSFLKKISKLEFLDYAESLSEVFNAIREKVDLIVVLSHLECKKTEALAKELNEAIIFLGGHDHRVLFRPITAGSSAVFDSGCYGGYVTKIEINVLPTQGEKEKKFKIQSSEVVEIG